MAIQTRRPFGGKAFGGKAFGGKAFRYSTTGSGITPRIHRALIAQYRTIAGLKAERRDHALIAEYPR